MRRIYCDSNIFRLLNPASPQFSGSVHDAFKILKREAVFVFSEAHLNDLSKSLEHYRDVDLKVMEEYTSDFYCEYDQINKKLNYLTATPSQAYNSKNFDISNKFLVNPGGIKELLKDLDDFPEKELLMNVIDSFLDVPIASLGNSDKNLGNLDDAAIKSLRGMMPNFNSSMSVRDLLTDFQPFLSRFLFENKEFDGFKKELALFMNKDDYNYERWGVGFNSQLKETQIKKTFLEVLSLGLEEAASNDTWLTYQHAYSLLEILNITDERSGGKRKKNSFLELSKDCEHVYYASSCNYLVTNDKGLQAKAHILYELFDQETEILTIEDLVGKADEWTLCNWASIEIFNHIDSFFEGRVVNSEDNKIISAILDKPFLNYFDGVLKFYNNDALVFFNSRNDGNYYLYHELFFISKKLFECFGFDAIKRGNILLEELSVNEEEDTILRIWNIEKGKVVLVASERKLSFRILFYPK